MARPRETWNSDASLAEKLKTIGRSERRVDSVKLATGRGTFVDDLTLPGTLQAVVLRSPYAHARIRRIDAARARALPGVVCVLTHEDVPRVPFTSAGQGWPEPSPYAQCWPLIDDSLEASGRGP